MKVINWIVGILLLVSLVLNGILVYKHCNQSAPEYIYVTDTMVIQKDSIIEKIKYKTKFDTIIDLQYKDTIIHDTIEIPIEHKVSEFNFKKDSFELKQKIHHSGFHSVIDSVECNYTFNYEVTKPKPKKFGWCITFGPSFNFGFNYDMVGNRVGAGPGVGVSVVVGPSYIIK